VIVFILPTLGWSWPALAPIVSAIAGYYGFKKFTARGDGAWAEGRLTQEMRDRRVVDVPIQVETTEPVAEELGRDEMLTFEKDQVTLMFHKDPRGKLRVRVMGPAAAPAQELQRIGLEFATSLVQQFAYSRLVRELDRRGVTVVGEERAENGDLVLRTRKWG